MLWLPTLKLDVAHVVVPAASACSPQPVMELAPSLKFTVPVGVPTPGATAATVAVNVTLWPNTDGFADDVSVVVVLDWLTTCDTTELRSDERLVWPQCRAGRPRQPSLKKDVAQVADPAASACAPQPVMELAPSLKSAVPVGVPAPGATAATVAVKVTLCPKTDGFTDDVRLVDVLAWLTTCDTAEL